MNHQTGRWRWGGRRRLLLGLGVALSALVATHLTGCDDATTRPASSEAAARGEGDVRPQLRRAPQADEETTGRFSDAPAQGLHDLDLGADWDRQVEQRAPAGRTLGGGTDRSRAGSQAVDQAGGAADEPHWAIVLRTFSGENHLQQSRQALAQIKSLAPLLRNARHHQSDNGSMLLLGRYESLNSPEAQRDLEAVKAIRIQARDPRTGRSTEVPAFPQAMIGRIKPQQSATSRLHPLDLMNLRRQYPQVDPLYTLDVAIWLAGEDSGLSMQEAERRAVAYARELRGRNLPAFFHVDQDKQIATVTVGAFGRDAIDPQSGLVSAEVKAVMQHFEGRLVNGEVLEIPISNRRPDLGTRSQAPVLVLVPEL